MNPDTYTSTISLRSLLAPALLAGCLFALPAQAVPFESFYGENATADLGQDIKAVRYCPGGGSVLAGTRRVPGFGQEVLVTRVDDFGTSLWQHAYRLAHSNDSRAQAIIELANGRGFALTGTVRRGNVDLFIYAMQLRCDGRPIWTTLLDNLSPGHQAIGYDLLEVSNPLSPNLQRDLLVVGDETRPGQPQRQFGRIARLDATGNVLWDHAYAAPSTLSPGMRFRAVTSAPSGSTLVEDFVVAGSLGQGSDWQFDRRALMFRVNASGNPICNTFLGSQDRQNEDFHGITTQRRAQQFTGGTVLIGVSNDPTGISSDLVYLTRFRPFTCDPVAQAIYVDLQGGGATGFDLIETGPNPAGVPGALAATGSLYGVSPGDGFVLLADPNNLAPLWTPIRFGTQGPGTERLVAIDQKGDQFVMAGSTNSDWNGTGNPLDFYMVQTTSGMRTHCSPPWDARWRPVALPRDRFQPRVARIANSGPIPVQVVNASGEGYACP